MPDTQPAAWSVIPPSGCLTPAVCDVVDLLERYAAADRELTQEVDRIGGEICSSRRVSHSTVGRLKTLLETSLVPGVWARDELDALPGWLRRAGIAAWIRRTSHLAQLSIGGTA